MGIRRTGEAEGMTKLRENRYGKSRVRLVRVKRHAGANDFQEWSVDVLLRGDFANCFAEGENSRILPTDTMKNTVYSVARSSNAACMEDFAKELTEFLLRRNPQVSEAEVSVSQKAWEHLNTQGKPHPTTFVQSSGECQTTSVVRKQNGELAVVSGLENLVIMKTADSAFSGYIKDSLTTLPESADRLFGTAVRASWTYARVDAASRLDQHRGPRAAASTPGAEIAVDERGCGFRGTARQDSRSAADSVCRTQKCLRAAHALRHGRRRFAEGPRGCGHRTADAESALPAGRSLALRAG